MYLCNLKLTSKELPQTLPERIRNEVSSMVDIISFAVPDDRSKAMQSSSGPNFSVASRTNAFSPPLQQPHPQQPTNSQLLQSLSSQASGIQPQMTGFPSLFVQNQQTGFQQNPQATGYNGLRPSIPSIPTSLGQGLIAQPTGMPIAPLNAQPTGRPGQWGLVNAPAGGLPNINALQQQMMPQAGREGGFSATGLRGNATVPWAVTKDEKKIYDNLFKAWDGFNKGFISGDQAIEIFGQSGLDKPDLEKIWTLSDPSNRGKLNLDEFAVAMHLIYRRLNGYPVPNQLPPELVPPSTRKLTDSIGSVKSMLSRDAEERKTSGAFLQPQKTGVSYLKTHSFRDGGSPTGLGRKDATVFRNNDDDVGYKSSARRRLGAGGRSPSPAQPPSPSSEASDDMSLDQIRKRIREKQVLLDALDFQDEGRADEDDALDRRDRREAEDLYRRIRRIQEDIDDHPNASFRGGDSDAERRALKTQLQRLTDRLPQLASDVRRTERAIADAKVELFRLKEAKANPGGASQIIGTGPGGAVTESDRLKARAKAMMQQRSAALRGEKVAPAEGDDATTRRFEEESSKVRVEQETNERMIRDVEDSVNEYSKGLEASLTESGDGAATEHERRRWEDGLGVEDEVRDFIFDLQRGSRSTRVRREDTSHDTKRQERPARGARDGQWRTSGSHYENPAPASDTSSRPAISPQPAGAASYSSYKTAEERAAFIKEQAEARMAERLAALGLRAPSRPSQPAQAQQVEKTDRLRKAEEEDAKREQERQRRLASEQIAPPSPERVSKKPPPPPARKGKAEADKLDLRQADQEVKRAEHEISTQAIREQQSSAEVETKDLE